MDLDTRNLSLGGGGANNKGADQPVHPRRLISAFVIRFLESIISKPCYKRNFKFLPSLCSGGYFFESRFVRNPDYRFCSVEANYKGAVSSEIIARVS